MNQTTPKSSGINYAKLRKQKYKEETIPKSMSNNLKYDVQHSILKHRSTSQHNINEILQQQQMQLFEQYFNQSKQTFLEFVAKQLQYHNSPVQVFFSPMKPNVNIFKNGQRKWEEEKRKILCELNQFKEDNCLLQTELHEIKKMKYNLTKQCENLQEVIVKERLGKQKHSLYHLKFQELSKNLQASNQETISSLTDERFESNETSLDSSLSNDEFNYEIFKTKNYRYRN